MKKENKVGLPTPKKWDLTDEQKLDYQSLYILYLMTEDKVVLPNFLGGNLKYVQESVDLLEKRKLIVQTEKITEGKKVLGVPVKKDDVEWFFELSEDAHQIVGEHRKRYREFLAFYDVFAHVDPMTGEFAMSKIKDILLGEGDGKAAWQSYKSQDCWIDYRVPVLVYKGIDPRESIFFSFMEEGRFIPTKEDTEHEWAKNLFLDTLWEEIYMVLGSAPIWEAQGDEENPAAEIMETIIVQGAKVLKKQNKKLRKFIKKQDEIIGLEEEMENMKANHQTDYEEYYDDPVHY
ncbi:MAG: hypothetical protein ACI97N_001015 [Cognaticolwellia sp.]|jgi:hypothetical protein